MRIKAWRRSVKGKAAIYRDNHGEGKKFRNKRYNSRLEIKERHRQKMMEVRNPLRAFYQKIGLEAHNLMTVGKWRG